MVSGRCAVGKLNEMRYLAIFRESLKEGFEYTGPAEPPEALPYTVPFAIFRWQCTPYYNVDSEMLEGLQKLTVIVPRLTSA